MNNKICNSGFGLFAAIIITTLFTTLIIVLATLSWTNSRMNALNAEEQRAFHLAESGMEYTIKKSIDDNNWDWSGALNYGGGTINVSSATQGGSDTTLVTSTAVLNNAARQNTMLFNIKNLKGYSIYLGGKLLGAVLGNPNQFEFEQGTLPHMNTDSMKAVACTTKTTNWTVSSNCAASFWSDPADHDKDASIIYVDGKLTVNCSILRGIIMVERDIMFKKDCEVYGIIYSPNATTNNINVSGANIDVVVYGAIIGNGKLHSNQTNFTVNLNSDYIDKFYTYAMSESEYFKFERLNWQNQY